MVMIVLLMKVCIESSRHHSFVFYLFWIATEGSLSTTTTTTTFMCFFSSIQASKVYCISEAQSGHNNISKVLLFHRTRNGFASSLVVLIWEMVTTFQVHPRLLTLNGKGYTVLLLISFDDSISKIPFENSIQKFHSKTSSDSSSTLLLYLGIDLGGLRMTRLLALQYSTYCHFCDTLRIRMLMIHVHPTIMYLHLFHYWEY